MTDGGKKPDLHVVGDAQSAPQSAAPESAPKPQWKTREAWIEDGRRLGERIERDRWALGDWACHGERAYGELAAAAANIGVAYQTLRHLASVAGKIELCRRRHNLSWSHHAEVASLPVETGDELLDRAAAEDWSRERMREEARAASRLGQLEAENKQHLAEIARLRQKRDPDYAAQVARETVDRTLVRMKAESRVVKEATSRAAAMFECLGADEIAGNIHGNKRKTLARDSARAFGALSAQVRTARADAAPTIERIAGRSKTQVEAAVCVLMDDTEEALHEIVRRIEAAELDPEQANAVKDVFEARMQAMSGLVKGTVHPAVKRLAGTGSSQ